VTPKLCLALLDDLASSCGGKNDPAVDEWIGKVRNILYHPNGNFLRWIVPSCSFVDHHVVLDEEERCAVDVDVVGGDIAVGGGGGYPCY